MRCIHIPDQQDIEPRLRSTLESAQKERAARFTQGELDE